MDLADDAVVAVPIPEDPEGTTPAPRLRPRSESAVVSARDSWEVEAPPGWNEPSSGRPSSEKKKKEYNNVSAR